MGALKKKENKGFADAFRSIYMKTRHELIAYLEELSHAFLSDNQLDYKDLM